MITADDQFVTADSQCITADGGSICNAATKPIASLSTIYIVVNVENMLIVFGADKIHDNCEIENININIGAYVIHGNSNIETLNDISDLDIINIKIGVVTL